ncbi:MAG: hypothetical protein KTR24_12960 [Saprospiraceae bacterium]|nr:hypothetical protein [Saprospiraceae bacterium]
MSEQPRDDFNFVGLVRFILSHLRLFILVGVIAAVVSAVISLIMTEYFTASAVVFPARINSVTLNDYAVRRGNISEFGEEEEAEQLLQIINSESLKERVMDRHDLYTHYEIDPKDPHARTELFETYDDYVGARRTKFSSVEITVTDKVPQMAADIANSIIEYIDTVKNKMIAERALASFGMVNDVYSESEAQLFSIAQRMDSLQTLGVATEQERAALYRAYGEALANNNRTAASQLKAQLDINKEFGDEYDILKRQRDRIADESLRLKFFREQFEADADLRIAQTFVVDHAAVPDKKSKPIRWLIVVGSTAAACLLTLVLLLLQKRLPELTG